MDLWLKVLARKSLLFSGAGETSCDLIRLSIIHQHYRINSLLQQTIQLATSDGIHDNTRPDLI